MSRLRGRWTRARAWILVAFDGLSALAILGVGVGVFGKLRPVDWALAYYTLLMFAIVAGRAATDALKRATVAGLGAGDLRRKYAEDVAQLERHLRRSFMSRETQQAFRRLGLLARNTIDRIDP